MSWWLSPQEYGAESLAMLAQRVKDATPAPFKPRILLPTLYGYWYQADPILRKRLAPVLQLGSADDVRDMRKYVEGLGVLFGTWSSPVYLDWNEGAFHARAALASGYHVLDVEPYSDFLGAVGGADRSPAEFWRGWDDQHAPRPGVSLVPVISGIDPLGAALAEWVRGAMSLHPQCYYTTLASLAPDIAIPYLLSRTGRARVVPILPNAAGVMDVAAGFNDVDIWTVGG